MALHVLTNGEGPDSGTWSRPSADPVRACHRHLRPQVWAVHEHRVTQAPRNDLFAVVCSNMFRGARAVCVRCK